MISKEERMRDLNLIPPLPLILMFIGSWCCEDSKDCKHVESLTQMMTNELPLIPQ